MGAKSGELGSRRLSLARACMVGCALESKLESRLALHSAPPPYRVFIEWVKCGSDVDPSL